MTKVMQAIMLNLLGLSVIAISVGNVFMAYVKPVMRIPLIITGGILIALAILWFVDAVRSRDSVHDEHTHGPDADRGAPHASHHREPLSAWFLLIPGVILFFAAPPALGAYDAARAEGNSIPVVVSEDYTQPLPAGDPVPIRVTDFVIRAIDSGGVTVQDRQVLMTGFVTPDPDGGWWLARQSMACCAADAQPVRVRIEGAPPEWENPPTEMWVDVTGTWIPETLDISGGTVPIPSLAVDGIVAIEPPASPYE
jgi:uncharacterized repeat protein (TIGR03943 family)